MHGEHLRTDHLLGDLRERAISGGFITTAAQAIKLGLNLVQAVVLARLLSPEDFGLVAMVTTITGFLRVFKDAGLSTATIQKAEITHAQVSNLFWINVGVSAFLSLVVAALAPLVAWFYRDPRLVTVTLALAGTFALSGAVVQHQALFNRQMRFKAIALIDVGSMSFGLLVGILMATLQFRYWALVGLQLSTGLAELALTLRISGWRPQRPTRGTGIWPMLQFGASLTVASVFRRIGAACDTLFIGRRYGADAVGLYTRGAVLVFRPVDQLAVPFESTFTPILSRLQGDPERYRRTFMQAYGAVALLWLPASGLLMTLSRPLVLVLLGPRWEQVIPIFAWFTVAGLFMPFYYLVMCLLNTQGRSKDIMITGTIFPAATVGALFAGLPFGAAGVAASLSCVGLVVRLPILNYIVGREGPVSTSDLWAAPLRYLPNWIMVVGVTHLTLKALSADWSPIVQLCLCAPAGVLAGMAVTFGFPSQRREVLRIWEFVKPWTIPLVSKFRVT